MSDLNTEIKIGADASGVEAGVGKAKRSLKDLGDAAQKAGKDAGSGIGSIGAGGDKAARDVERATKNIQGQLQRAVASFEAGEKGSRQFYESLARQRGVDVGSLKPLLDQLDAVKTKSQAAAQASAQVGSSFSSLGTAAGLAARAFAAIGIGASVGEFIRMADASTNVASRLGLVTSSAAELASVQQRLFNIAQSSRVSFTDLVGTYSQVARSTKDLGVSQTALLGVIQTISQAVTISGGSAASAQAALVQLSQGFAAGALRGEELNSILEQTPRLAQAMADGLGVGVGKLREMGQAGELTAERVLGPLEKSAGKVSEEFGKMAVTVEQASTNAANSAMKLVGVLDKITGASGATAGGISRLSSGMDSLALNIERLSSSKGLSDFFFLAFNNERSLNGELAITQKELSSLEARLAKAPSNIYTRSAVAEMREYVKELKEAQARLASLSGQSTAINPAMNAGVTASGQARERFEKQRAADVEAANTFRLRQSGVPDGYLKEMAELIRLNQAGVLVGKEYTDALKKQQDTLLKKTGVTKDSNAAANQELNTYESLTASIRAKIAENEAEISGAGRLNESDKLRIKLLADLNAGAKTLTAAHRAQALALLDKLNAQEQEESRIKGLVAAYKQEQETAEEIAQAYVAQDRARAAGRQSITEYVKGIDESNDAHQLELSLMGQSEQSRAVALDQYRIELDLKKQIAAINDNAGFNETEREEERARARAGAAIAKANAASKAFLDEWKTSVSKYDDIFRQGFADMLNNGKDGWKSFTKSLVTTFKTTVADQIYKMFAQPFVVKLVGSLLGLTGVAGVAGVANAASGGSALGAVGTGASIYNAGTGMAGMAGGFANGLSAWGAGGSVTGVLSNPGLYTGAELAGAFAPIALGLLAVVALFKKFDDSGTPHIGAGAIYSEAGGLQSGADIYNKQTFGMGVAEEYAKGTQDGVSMIARSLTQTFDGIAKTFGQTAGYEIATAFADDSSKDGAWGSLRISKDGKDLLNWAANPMRDGIPKEFANGEEGYKEYLAAIAKDTRTVLLDMDLPSWADTMLESIGEAANMEQLAAAVQQIGVIQTSFVNLGKTIDGFAGMTDKAFESLMKAAGGIDALSANAGTYYGNFYSEQERAAKTTAMMTDELAKYDTALPQSKEAYRKLVEEQLAAGEEGAKLAAVLLSLSGVFAETANAAEAAAASIAGKRFDLENRLLVLQGRGREALDRQRGKEWEALTKESPELGRLISQIWELEDAANAAAKVEAARQSSYSALENAIARERDAIDVQRSMAAESVDTLTGIFETIRGNVRELYSEVDGTAAMQVSQANAFIDQALRNAQTTGYMPDGAKLSEAIGTARSGLSSGAYTSQFEADRDRLVLAGKLSTLGEITGEQLTTAERQLKYSEEQIDQLDKTLDYWRKQIDIANGTYEATLSVAEAISKLQALMFPDAQKPSTVPNASGGGASFGGGSGAASGPAAAAKYNDLQFIGGGDPARQAVIDQERIAKLDMLSPIYHSFDGTGDLLGLFDAIKAAGGTLADLSTLSGYWQSDWRKAAESVGVPAFAVGTNYVPRDMLAQIHEGEAIVPKAYNPAANPGMAGGGTARLEALIEKLTAKVEQLEGAARATASNTAGMPQMADQFDSVTNGGNAIRNKAIA